MTYRMLRFDSVLLPDRIPEEDFSSGNVESTLLDSVGGTFDYFGDRPRLPRRIQISHQGRYLGGSVLWVTEDGDTVTDENGTPIAVRQGGSPREQVDTLKALTGQRLPLWRQRVSDDALQWRMARLMAVDYIRIVDDVGRVADLDIVFETNEVTWKALTANEPSVAVSAGDIEALVISNAGSVEVDNAVVRVLGTSGTITGIDFFNGATGVSLFWSGTLASGETLELDDGLQTIRKDGVDAYSGLTLQSNHSARSWFLLAPGPNVVAVTLIGGDGTVTVEFYNQWI